MTVRACSGAAAMAFLVLAIGACSSGGNTITQARCPCTLEVASGDGQSGAPGSQLSEELVVRLVDANGDGILGALILWQITSGNGQITPDCIPTTCPNGGTDPSGFNRARWTLGGASGTQTVQASSLQAAEVATFTAQAGTS